PAGVRLPPDAGPARQRHDRRASGRQRPDAQLVRQRVHLEDRLQPRRRAGPGHGLEQLIVVSRNPSRTSRTGYSVPSTASLLGEMAMRRMAGGFVYLAAVLGLAVGCAKPVKVAQLSGTVLFKGKPVPAGYISFMPDAAAGNTGSVKVFQIKDGVFDTAQEKD